MRDFSRLIIRYARGPLAAYCVEEVERQQFREVSDLQAVFDRSIAAVLASLGWQNFYLNINVPAFFNTTGQKRSLAKLATDSGVIDGNRYPIPQVCTLSHGLASARRHRGMSGVPDLNRRKEIEVWRALRERTH